MPPPDNLFDVVTYSLRYAADFSWYSLRGQPLPTLVFITLVALTAFLAAGSAAPRLWLRRAATGMIITLAAGYLLVVCCMAPSAYGALLYPPGRALMVARFALLLSLGSAALIAGLAARAMVPEQRRKAVQVLAALLLLAVCIYPLRALAPMREEISLLAVKAARWDERDAQILAQRGAGVREVLVRETDVVQTLEDLSPDKDFWVNRCASRYYNVESITALP
jgi:hypothetical protein